MANQTGSILAADFGNVTTRVVLLDVVDGEYRLVALGAGGTTVGYPVDNVSLGLRRILQEITLASGRVLYDDRGELIIPENSDRSGVDHFVTTASAGRPMRAVLVALMPDVSLASLRRATAYSYIEPVEEIHLEDDRGEEERLNALMLSQPDVIVIAGGTEGGAASALHELLQSVRLALEISTPQQRPNILYAGNNRLAGTVREMFGDLTEVFIAENVRPSMAVEQFDSVQAQLARAFDEHKDRTGGAFSEVALQSTTGVRPTAQSYTLITEYYATQRGGNVVAVDIGSASTILVGAFGRQVNTDVSTVLGLGHSAASLLDTTGEETVARWLPFVPEAGELQTYVMNKTLRPATVPMNLRDVYIEHALLRAALDYMVAQARRSWHRVDETGALPEIDLVVAGGAALTRTGSPPLSLMLVADTIQPTGITEVLADPHGLVPALGAAAAIQPEAVVQMLDGHNLDRLGTIISLDGEPQPGKVALRLKITTEDEEVYEHEIEGGHLWALPLPEGVTLALELKAARGLSIGGRRRVKRIVTGGSAGVLFDARGRPLRTGNTPQQRAKQIPLWIHQATDEPLQEIPERWLEGEEPEFTPGREERRRRRATQEMEVLAEFSEEEEAVAARLAREIPEIEEGDEDDEFLRLLREQEDDFDPFEDTGGPSRRQRGR